MEDKIKIAYSYDDVLLVPRYSKIKSRSDVDLTTQITPKLKLQLPLISSNMSDVTGVEMAIALGKMGGLGVLPRFMTAEEQAKMVNEVKKTGVTTAAAIGLKNGMFDRAEILVKAGADVLFLDVAHGHMNQTIEATKLLKSKFKNDVDIISGNVATYEAANDLFSAGADSVKVGVGPGSICITRIETGFGVPQLSAVLNASRAARKYNKTIIADGGTKNSGDVVKALAAGASAIMAGNLFAGTEETPSKTVVINGIKYKNYFGSTSLMEKEKHIKKDKTNNTKNYAMHIEGVEGMVIYKGPVKSVVEKLEANIRSGFSYAGADNLQALWKKAKFVRITPMGQRESGPHDINPI